METFSHRLPAENRPPFFTCPEKLRESLASASSFTPQQTPTVQTELPATAKASQLTNYEASRGKPNVHTGGKIFRRVCRQSPKSKSSLKPPLKAKEMKSNKVLAIKGKDKEKFANLNHAPAAVSLVNSDSTENIYPVTNILKNLAMKIKQSPEISTSNNQPESSKISPSSSSQCQNITENPSNLQPTVNSSQDVSTNSVKVSQSSIPASKNTNCSYQLSELNPFSVKNSDVKQDDVNMDTTDDDFGFVFDVLDTNGLTGANDDITDWLFQNLPDTEKAGVTAGNVNPSTNVRTGLVNVKNSSKVCHQDNRPTPPLAPIIRPVLSQPRLKRETENSNLKKNNVSAQPLLPDFSKI